MIFFISSTNIGNLFMYVLFNTDSRGPRVHSLDESDPLRSQTGEHSDEELSRYPSTFFMFIRF